MNMLKLFTCILLLAFMQPAFAQEDISKNVEDDISMEELAQDEMAYITERLAGNTDLVSQKSSEELLTENDQVKTLNKALLKEVADLTKTNDFLVRKNEELSKSNEALEALNQQIAKFNQELLEDNEELAAEGDYIEEVDQEQISINLKNVEANEQKIIENEALISTNEEVIKRNEEAFDVNEEELDKKEDLSDDYINLILSNDKLIKEKQAEEAVDPDGN